MSDDSAPLPTDERRTRIRTVLEESGFARVADLSAAFGVSTVTVRTDLDALETQGAVRRIRGGAMPTDPSGLRERPFEESQIEAAPQKARIASAAADLVESGMSVLLDVGTTTTAIARELVRREDLSDVTVVTSGVSIGLMLEPAIPRLHVILTGGTLRPLQHSLVSPLGALLLGHVHADLALIGCNGVDAGAGITNINLPEAEIKRAMVTAASRVVVVADGSKIGRARLGKIASIDEIDMVITDRSAPKRALDDLAAVDGLVVVTA